LVLFYRTPALLLRQNKITNNITKKEAAKCRVFAGKAKNSAAGGLPPDRTINQAVTAPIRTSGFRPRATATAHRKNYSPG